MVQKIQSKLPPLSNELPAVENIEPISQIAHSLFDLPSTSSAPPTLKERAFLISSEDPTLADAIKERLTTLFEPNTSLQEEACRLIIDSFAHMMSHTNIQFSIENVSEGDGVLGAYKSLTSPKLVILHPDTLTSNTVESTAIHEMTHALHFSYFKSAWDFKQEIVQKEMGLTMEELSTAIIAAREKIPSHIRPYETPISTIKQDPERFLSSDMIRHFLPIDELIAKGLQEETFSEFLARIPQMYYIYRELPKEAIDKALKDIFPIGFDFFWGKFKQKCEREQLYPFSITCSDPGNTDEKEERIYKAFADLYRDNPPQDPKSLFILQAFHKLAETKKTEEKFCFDYRQLDFGTEAMIIPPQVLINSFLSGSDRKTAILGSMTQLLFAHYFGRVNLSNESFVREKIGTSKSALEQGLADFGSTLHRFVTSRRIMLTGDAERDILLIRKQLEKGHLNGLQDYIQYHFQPIQDSIDKQQYSYAFVEFLSKTAQIYFLCKDCPKELVDKTIQELFPIGYSFFWDQFKKATIT